MQQLIVQGKHRIAGTITPSGNKNEALPALAAALLTNQPVTIENVPDIRDITDMFALLSDVGADVQKTGANCYCITTKQITNTSPDRAASGRIRGSLLLLGVLLARAGHANLAMPGGDRIGWRRPDTHINVLMAMGATPVPGEVANDLSFEVLSNGLHGIEVLLDEASVTGTENAILAAVLAKGETVIDNAASEPHVQGLCHMLVKMGAAIEGIGTNRLQIEGVSQLKGCTHRLRPDHIEIGSFVGLAAACGGVLRIEEVFQSDLRMITHTFQRLGMHLETEGSSLVVDATHPLKIPTEWGKAIPKFDSGPWPALPSDLLSIIAVVITQTQGTALIFEKMFENRLFWLDRLITMGGQVLLCDLHRALVMGPTPLHGAVISSPDIRAGMALLIAALCAEGETVIQNCQQIDRGYERIDERLAAVGAVIERKVMD